jgi:hypothetical protein
MANALHLANAKGRDATVGISAVKPPPQAIIGLPGETIVFRRYLAATDDCANAALLKRFGGEYSAALLEGDPEIDMEAIGQAIADTSAVFIDSEGELMYAEPHFIEVVTNPDGSEKDRHEPQETPANINVQLPVKWTGKNIPIADAVRRFCFQRALQLRHVDGLTFDYLFEMASELEKSQSLMLLGSGEKGTGPLVFQANGRGYRGFLEGRTDGKRYQLLLRLSDMELKKPAAKPAAKTAKAADA